MVVKDFHSVGKGWSFVQYDNIAATSFMCESRPKTKYVLTKGLVVRNIVSPYGENIGKLKKNDDFFCT